MASSVEANDSNVVEKVTESQEEQHKHELESELVLTKLKRELEEHYLHPHPHSPSKSNQEFSSEQNSNSDQKKDETVSDESLRKRLEEIVEELGNVEVHLENLKKTKIGRTVNELRHHKLVSNSQELNKSLSALIRKWKNCAKNEFHSKSISEEDPPESPKKEKDATAVERKRKRTESGNSSEDGVGVASGRRHSGGSSSSLSLADSSDVSNNQKRDKIDAVRQKCIDLLKDAIHPADDKKSNSKSSKSNGATKAIDIDNVVAEIEKEIYEEFGRDSACAKYRAKIRSKISNLKDPANPKLRERLLSGKLEGVRFAHMSAEEMASKRLRQWRRSVEEESIKEHEMPDNGEVQSNMFRCEKCKERDTTYSLSQEKQEGEYEPVEVTLIVCNHCGHRWKSF